MASRQRVVIPAGDPEREYSTEEVERLSANLHRLFDGVHSGVFSEFSVDIRLLESLHRNIFAGVRGHAGRIRGSGTGSEYLTFGPHRSIHRSEVPDALDALFIEFSRVLASLEANRQALDYEDVAITAAVKLHADIIRVHPFEDGNGRTTRALLNIVLVRLGLRPLVVEAPKQEYFACLNHYFRTADFGPLRDFVVRLYFPPD